MSTAPFLRPMTVGDLLDQAIRIYRQNLVTCIGVVAVISVPLLLLQLALTLTILPSDPFFAGTGTLNNPGPLLLFYVSSFVLGIVTAIAWIFEISALAVVISEAYLGHAVTIGAAYRAVLKRGLSLLGASLLLGLLNLVLIGIATIPLVGLGLGSAVLAGSQSNAIIVALLIPIFCLAMLVALVLIAILDTHFIFSSQAVVLENHGAISGLRRSWNLVRGSFFRVFIILVVLGIFIYVVTLIPAATLSWGVTIFSGSLFITTIANSVMNGLVSILISPIEYAVLTLLYYDLRIRKEGFDLQTMAQQIAPVAPAVEA